MFYFVKLCARNLLMECTVIGQSTSVYKHQTSVDDVVHIWLSKVYFQCECAYFRKKNFKIFIAR